YMLLSPEAPANVIRDSAGKMLRPDAVIYYPDGRSVIVDSKVSLTAYIDFVNSEPSTPESQAALQSHLRSVRSHITELATKNYQDFIGDRKADFVTMFIPNEGAYLAAMQADSKLWQDAYDRRVLIVSPTHLLSVLKLVEQMWRQDDMKRNVLEIAEESGKMYDKFVGFVDDMAKIDKSLTQAGAAFSDAMKKLSEGKGNLVGRAEKLRKMGAKANKRLTSPLVEKALPEADEEDKD
ncbi:MAG: DNA recombination protein RmuC, partial [Muribaculaceae bacterium]|nr:DNA recombination protein RmuC [Muribaculaceae bacterium]